METQPLYAAGNTWESKTLLRSWTFWTTSAQLGIDSHPSLHPFYCTVCYKTFQALLCGSEATAFAQQCWLRVKKDTQSTIFTWSRRWIFLGLCWTLKMLRYPAMTALVSLIKSKQVYIRIQHNTKELLNSRGQSSQWFIPVSDFYSLPAWKYLWEILTCLKIELAIQREYRIQVP